MLEKLRLRGLSGNQLKIIALIAMTLDHAGKELMPGQMWMQVIGRLAFPIFAYMVAEGCLYTRSRGRYLGWMAGLAFLCQMVYWFVMGSLYQSVLVTFTLAILVIYTIDKAKKTEKVWIILVVATTCFGAVWFLCEELPKVLWATDYCIDYGLAGVLLVVGLYYAKRPMSKLVMAGVILIVLAITFGGVQWYGLLALLPLALYNGQRGKMKLKYLFYIYYPAHLVVIYLIGLLTNMR